MKLDNEYDCPACGVTLIDTGHKLGDVLICIGCRVMLLLDITSTVPGAGTIVLRRPTDDEELVFLRKPQVQATIRAVAAHHEQHGSPHPQIRRPDDH